MSPPKVWCPFHSCPGLTARAATSCEHALAGRVTRERSPSHLRACLDERMDTTVIRETVRVRWAADSGTATGSLAGLVEIPALSPAFDAEWATTRQLHAAVDHVRTYLDARGFPGASTEVVELPGRTPVLLLDVPATDGARGDETVVVYGHLDKQPAAGEWSPGLGPWTPSSPAAGCTAAARATTGTRPTRRRPPSKRCTRAAAPMRARSSCWRRARSPAAPTSVHIWNTCGRGWARSASSSASTLPARTTNGCGWRRHCAGWSRSI